MRALSWKEPYASLMLHGKIETRKWKTNIRGPVLICCSKKPYSLHAIVNISGEEQTQRIRKVLGDDYPSVNGMAIAIGNLVDCRPMTPEDEDACFVKYQPGLWCHIYKEVKPIKPFPYKGKQGWSNIGDGILEKLGYKVEYTIMEISPELIREKWENYFKKNKLL